MPVLFGPVLFTVAVALQVSAPGRPQPQRPNTTGSIEGSVTTQKGSIPVVGARVVATDMDERVASETRSTEAGRFQLVLSAGRYRVRATQPPFEDRETLTDVTAGQTTRVDLDLGIGSFTESVTVTPGAATAMLGRGQTSSGEQFTASALDALPVASGGDPVIEAQRLAPGVIAVGGGVSIKGGHPFQNSVLLGRANVTDPSTGNTEFRLPWDAVQSVEVLPNPYAVEFGRFSSGVTVIETRSGDDTWRFRANNFVPGLRTRRGRPLEVLGVRWFGPQVSLRGPVLKNVAFLAQSFEYRYQSADIASRDQSEITTRRAMNSFTRLDVRLGGQLVTTSVSIAPQDTSALNLNTFTPPDVAADLEQNLVNVTVSNVAALSPTSVLETLVHVNRFWAQVGPRDGVATGMDLTPTSHAGRYFTDQRRDTRSYQLVETWSHLAHGRLGDHLFKGGVDLLHTISENTRSSAPVTVRRVDGTVSRRVTFSGGTPQRVAGTDVAVFAQDRWQAGSGRVIEAGVRLDRDGILGVMNPTGRVGFAMVLGKTGSAVLRGGVGLFYERTPSLVGGFSHFERITDQRFATNGITPLAPASSATPGLGPQLQTPRSVFWSAGYSHRLAPTFAAEVNLLSRRGSREFIVSLNPERTAVTLDSVGRSDYREVEFGLRHSGRLVELNASYTHSRSRADLNVANAFYGGVPAPIIGPNEYAFSEDVPHRLIARLQVNPSDRWRVGSLIEWRTGWVYGVLDEFHEPMTPRNSYRMPAISRVDLSFERRFHVRGYRPWITIRVHNVLNTSDAGDVQIRLDAPNFGATFNSPPRQYRVLLRFQ